jgi:creatinine amidohydrolase
MTAAEIASLDREAVVVVLPIGAIEQHGPHLATGVDALLAQEALERALARLPGGATVLALPLMPYGKSTEHEGLPGALSLGALTMLQFLSEIGASVARSGFRRLFILNGHGGNRAVLEIAVRDLRARHGLITAQGSWEGFADAAEIVGADEARDGLHAGDVETSAMLHAFPRLVRPGACRDFGTAQPRWAAASPRLGLQGRAAQPGWIISDIAADGAVGNAGAATAAKGQLLLDRAAEAIAAFLAAFATFEPGPGA